MKPIESTLEVVGDAASAVANEGLLGALLILSLVANVALVWAVIRCYRSHSGYHRFGGTNGQG